MGDAGMKRLLLAALVGIMVSGSGWAYEKETIGGYLEQYDNNPAIRDYIIGNFWGLKEGLLWANAFAQARGDNVLYCPPGNMVIQVDQAISIFRNFVERKDAALSAGIDEIGFFYVQALQETFPCP
jgi:hypothetical protein